MVDFKARKNDIISIAILLVIVLVFFSRLFYPHTSLFITPEYNGSDTTNFNIPVKLILSNALKAGEFPLWEKTIATGFPLLAETQIGYFFLPNFLLFKFLSFPIAFNLGYILSFFLACSGMYAFMRHRKQDSITSLFCGFVFGFSGFYAGHMNHYNMLQSASLLPWLVLLFDYVRERKNVMSVLIFSLVLSQQIFAGYAQITFITLCTIGALYLVELLFPIKTIKKRIKPFIIYTILLLIGTTIALILCAVMLIPTRELIQQVARPQNYDVLAASYFSFPFVQFQGFLSPFILGSPKFGTFPPPIVYYGTFFWETVQYIGLIPLIAIVVYVVKNFKKQHVLFLGVFIGVFTILMLGKFSPAYFIYSLTPFNIFRVPSRFILPVIFGMVILFGYSLNVIQEYVSKKYGKKKVNYVIVVLLLLTVCDIFYYWYSYYPTVKAETWLSKPEFVEYIEKDGNQGRVMTPRGGFDKANIYGKYGWNKAEDYYVFNRNEMIPNANSIWGISQLQGYTGLSTYKRHNLFEAVLEFATDNREKTRADILLDVANVGYIIVSHENDQPYKNMKLVKTVKNKQFNQKLLLYKNPSVLPRARVVTQYKVLKSINDTIRQFFVMKEKLITTVLLEEKPHIKSLEYKENIPVKWVQDTNQHIILQVEMPVDGMLILADIIDPNWHAYDNGKLSKIYAADLIQRGVTLKKGSHTVEFKYEPQSFYLGGKISIFAHIIVFAILALFAFRNQRISSSKD